VALDPEHRLVVSVMPGKRTVEKVEALLEDFQERTEGRPKAPYYQPWPELKYATVPNRFVSPELPFGRRARHGRRASGRRSGTSRLQRAPRRARFVATEPIKW
jgi:hypothetical protein